MPEKLCTHPDCYVHEGEMCWLGELDPKKCKCWTDRKIKQENAAQSAKIGLRVPWSGNVLGLKDLFAPYARSRSITLGVIGPHNAGKTTFLLGCYLHLFSGKKIADADFAGSLSLEAWESLAAWVRFVDADRPPSFPPHTPRGVGRHPGMLHLALRTPIGELRDVLMTDAPGEWFNIWSIREEAPEAEGARWIIRHSDAFLVFADCQALTGHHRGLARDNIRGIIERLSNHAYSRPVALIWAKSDCQVNETIKMSIQDVLNKRIPHALEFETSTTNVETFERALSPIVSAAWGGGLLPIMQTQQPQNRFGVFARIYE